MTSLSFVVPAYNESQRIEGTLKEILKFSKKYEVSKKYKKNDKGIFILDRYYCEQDKQYPNG